MRLFPRRLVRSAVLVSIVTIVTGATLSSARAESPEPTPVVTVQSDHSVRVDDSVRVSVARATTRPVTISWGDGASTRVRVRCTSSQARVAPHRCATTARHSYKSAGVFRIKVSRARFSVTEAVMRVAGTVAASAQAAANWREDMLERLNAFRSEVGAAPLSLCPRLTATAQDYADVMATRNYYGHVGPDGSEPWDRMRSHGYDWSSAAENIAGGYESVEGVVTGWRNSSGHYENIVNPAFTHVGFGHASSATSTYVDYWVQNFGTGGDCTR